MADGNNPHPRGNGNGTATTTSTANGSAFKTLSIAQVQSELVRLYQQIACEHGRVQIEGADGVCTCVLISKAELDSLEQALEILSNTQGIREISRSISHVAHTETRVSGATPPLPAAKRNGNGIHLNAR